ncbi:hypothetical protein [Antrihabitans sp. YC2-6]|nr:hypothetical protein [Antrihabitans sp. YC2-6]MBJ8344626.1 hypothetical protein [Antrihabitans sp. YC2-6]
MIRADQHTVEMIMERRRHRQLRHHHRTRAMRRMQAHFALEHHLFAAG